MLSLTNFLGEIHVPSLDDFMLGVVSMAFIGIEKKTYSSCSITHRSGSSRPIARLRRTAYKPVLKEHEKYEARKRSLSMPSLNHAND